MEEVIDCEAIERTRRDLRSRILLPAIEPLADTALTETRSASFAYPPPNLGERNYLAEAAVEIRSSLSVILAVLGDVTASGIYKAL